MSILYVEDEAETRELIADALSSHYPDLPLHIAADGAEGLALFRKHRPQIVITDIRMPVMDGVAMGGHIMELEAQTQLIALTAYSDTSFLLGAIETGFSHYVLKPIDYPKLYQAVAKSIATIELRRRVAEQNEQIRSYADNLERTLEAERQATASLRESEEKYRAIVDHAGVGIMETREDDRFVAVNDRACEMLGYTREEILGMSVAELTAPEDRSLTAEVSAQVHAGTLKRTAYEKRYLKKDGTKLWVHVTISVVPDRHGKRWRSVTTLADISSRKSAETALRESRQRLEEVTRLLEYAPVLVRNMRDEITIWTTGVQSLYGFSESEALGRVSHRLLKTVFPRPLEEIQKTLLEKGRWQGELRHTTRSGSEVTVASLWILHVSDDTGETAVIEVNSDITARKKAEERLLRSETQFRQLAEALPQIVWICRPDGQNEYFNARWYDFTGATAEESLGFQWTKYLHPDDFAQVVASWSRSVQSGERHEVENRFRRADGAYHWFVSRALPLRDENGRITRWFGTSTDVEALKNAQQAAEAAARVKTDFMANMSHEIRTPMNGILGIADLLFDTRLDPLQHQYLDMIRSSAEALLMVVNDVLDFSKLEAGAMVLEEVEFDLRDTVERAVENLAIGAFRKGLELTVVVDPEVPHFVLGDPAKLRQVILNLVGNAVKFTEKGEIAVKVVQRGVEGESCALEFAVSDTGIGIPEEKLEEVFGSFTQADTTTSRIYGGTGLGLAICRGIIDKMGGRIWAESREGEGSTFRFEVKLAKVQRLPREVRVAAGGTRRALVVDDNATNRLMLERTLSAKGMAVQSAETGAQGVQAALDAAQGGSPFDLVFLDMHLPDMDGFAVAEQIRHRYPVHRSAVIMVTSDDIAGGARRSRDLGMAAYLVKPIRAAALEQALALVQQPRSEAAPPRMEEAAPSPAAASAPLCTHVLIAEDNPVNLTVIDTMLRKAGARVASATNGRQAVEALKKGTHQVVLMDVQMPEMDGLEATRAIRGMGWTVPIIGLTAHAMEGDRDRCIAAGMDDYLSKPVARDELLEKVVYWAQQKRARSSAPERALQQVMGDRPSFELVLRSFLENTPTQLEEVKAAATAQDAARLEKAAHRLKGAIAVVGADAARCLAEQLEEAGKLGDLGGAPAVVAELEAELARVWEELSGTLSAPVAEGKEA